MQLKLDGTISRSPTSPHQSTTSVLQRQFNVSLSSSSNASSNTIQQQKENEKQQLVGNSRHSPSANVLLQSLTSDPHRYFGKNPITAEESQALTELRGPSSNLRMAVCHPTIHYESALGNLTSLEKFMLWVSYYRLLGFDHIFFWHLPVIREKSSGFEQLRGLPYVTMTEVDKPGGTSYFGQLDVMRDCLRNEKFARNYDWVLLIDADEFLWFDSRHLEDNGNEDDKSSRSHNLHPLLTNSHDGETPTFYHIKDWLIGNGYQEKYYYISFGKYAYTLTHSYIGKGGNETEDFPLVQPKEQNHQNASIGVLNETAAVIAGTEIITPSPYCPFGELEHFPFTAGQYCYKNPTAKSCPDWKGRSKILMNPLQRGQGVISVHGPGPNVKKPYSIHMDTKQVAHIKEWSRWLHQPSNVTKHNTTQSFFVSDEKNVLTTNTMLSHPKNSEGQVEFFHDDQWLPWLEALSQGFPDSPNLPYHGQKPPDKNPQHLTSREQRRQRQQHRRDIREKVKSSQNTGKV